MDKYSSNLISLLKEGGVAVIPTDTLYGVVGTALNENTVKRIYEVRKRSPSKPFIILISSKNDLKLFGVVPTLNQESVIDKYWPGPVSIILECSKKDLEYLHRGTNTLAFRVPGNSNFRDFLGETGPLVAPSANPEGMPPAKTIREAQNYFGDEVDIYVSTNKEDDILDGKPSKIIKLESDGTVTLIRP